MNSKQLQLQFYENYNQLFANSDVVTSGHFWFGRFPTGLWHYTNRINLKSKIDLKAFVWIKKINNWKIIFNDLDIFDLDDNVFKKQNFSNINKYSKEIVEFLQKFLQQKNIKFGIEINILSEVARWHWLWFSWTIFANLATGIFILGGLLDTKLINDYDIFQKTDIFKEIQNIAKQMEFIAKKWNTGTWVLTAMTNLTSPTIYLCEKDKHSLEHIENIAYYFSNFPKKFNDIKNIDELPLDYAIVYTWILANTHRIAQLKQTDQNMYKVYEDFFHKEISPELKWTHHITNILNKKNFYNNIDDIGSLLSIETTYLFKQIFMFGDTNQNIDNFIENINKLNAISHIAEGSSQFLEDFKAIFQTHMTIDEENIWIMPIYSGKRGGDFLIVMQPWISRETFEKTINKLRTSYENIAMPYISREDGNSTDWIKLEQFISWWKFSEHVDKNQVVYFNNQWDKYMDDYGDIIQKEQSWFLLDSIWGKIYLDGVKLTSKDIKSQSTTIELFELLLSNLWEEIYNNQLSPSTYAGQQNQMLWKIIMPFKKLVEKRYNEKLPLICKWSLRNFYIKLENTDIKIWIIKKI